MEAGVSFVALSPLAPRTERRLFLLAEISRHLTNSPGRSLLGSFFFYNVDPVHLWASERPRTVDPTKDIFLIVRSIEGLNGKALKEAGR
jgi:hypothetical protein